MADKSIFLFALGVILSVVFIEMYNSSKQKHPYAGFNIEKLVHKYGYPLEIHEVISDDGYILTLHRIPHGRENFHQKRIPVLFMHGFFQSASDFVSLGPKNALSFLLVDRGYDVWLGNARGTTWSRKHKILNPNKDKAFWDYSLHEIGIYDVPAFIDHILKVTQQDSLHYVGYSQGTSVFFILGSEKPEYSNKVRLMTALAPAVFLKDPKGLILNALVYSRKAQEFLFEFFNVQEFLSADSFIARYLKHICNENSIFVGLCLHHIFLMHGYNYEEVNKTELSLIFSNTPAGVSPKQMLHINQLMESGNFHRYDLGIDGNMKKYGQPQPPNYDVERISTPIALYYSNNDWTINTKNVERIVKTLPNVVSNYSVPLKSFNHNDFINAKNVANLLYNAVVEKIDKY